MAPLSRNARAHHRGHGGAKKIIISVLVIGLILTIAVGGVGAAYAFDSLQNLPDYKKAGAFDTAQPSLIYAADGTLLASLYLQNRTSIKQDQMGKYARNATVAVEDERFFQHGGIDPAGIVRAVIKGSGGASTLTQQYIRQTILSSEATQMTLKRKIREAYLAMQFEKEYNKQEILTMYLNTVYYGERAYGIQAAAQTYFSKNAADLTLPEAALLAGLPQRPNGLDPVKYPQAATTRRNHVLDRMFANNYITKKEYDEAKATPLQLTYQASPDTGVKIYSNPYFVSEVKKKLLNNQKAYHITYDQIFKGGLKVKTTLNPTMQNQAQESVTAAIGDSGPECALVTVDPKTGWIQAMVGGRSFQESQVNLATSGNQVGSTFKVFTLTTAIEAGMSPDIRVNGDAPVTLPWNGSKGWPVVNSEGKSQGMISLAQATYASVNGAYARIVYALGTTKDTQKITADNGAAGAAKVAATAHKMGITAPLTEPGTGNPPGPSITLGAYPCSPLDMASAFATLANNGVYHKPTYITSITDQDGNEVYKWEDAPQRVLTPSIACAVNKILQGVVTGGTGTPARVSGRQIAGKTGTTNDSTDVWFVGFTPNFCTSVWVGHREGVSTVRWNGRMAYGGTTCGPIWKAYAQQVFATLPVEDFPTAPAPPYNNNNFKIPDGLTAPDVVGLDYQTAFDKLTAAGYKVVWVEQVSSAPTGTIINQSVNGNTVTLTVSSGSGSSPDSGSGSSQSTTGTP